MKKVIFKRLALIVAILIAIVCITVAYKYFYGTRIQHFAQYIYPCEGQIVTVPDNQTVVSFYVLDEKDISELSEKSNINSVALIDQNGDEWVADDWDVVEAGFYQGNEFSAKELDITLSFTQEITIELLRIKYPDKTETFNIGSLKIYPLTMDNLAANTQIYSLPDSMNLKNMMIDEDSVYYQVLPSLLNITANSLLESYSIINIDFGIQGLGVDPSTEKFVTADTDFGTSFTNDPDNETYLVSDAVDELPNQNIDIDIESIGSDFSYVIIALRHDINYDMEPASKYISPIYTCVDNVTNQQYIYGDFNYYIITPQVVSDGYAASLLKEFGQ